MSNHLSVSTRMKCFLACHYRYIFLKSTSFGTCSLFSLNPLQTRRSERNFIQELKSVFCNYHNFLHTASERSGPDANAPRHISLLLLLAVGNTGHISLLILLAVGFRGYNVQQFPLLSLDSICVKTAVRR